MSVEEEDKLERMLRSLGRRTLLSFTIPVPKSDVAGCPSLDVCWEFLGAAWSDQASAGAAREASLSRCAWCDLRSCAARRS